MTLTGIRKLLIKQDFQISTTAVDKLVDKMLLTARKTSINAGFNKMHNSKAKININKINDLEIELISLYK